MNPAEITRYPLAWPLGWRRTPAAARIRGTFRATRHDVAVVPSPTGGVIPQQRTREVAVSVFVATQRLDRELDRLGASNPTLSTNVQLRLDGRPRSDSEPGDPGAAIYFAFRGKATVLACDRYQRCADNIAAMAAHIDALRRIDRYGVGTLEQALAGYKALPADTAADWRAVLGFAPNARPTVDQVHVAYRDRARLLHPDAPGGNEGAMAHLNRARDYALEELEAA
jgi:hypothetical protein